MLLLPNTGPRRSYEGGQVHSGLDAWILPALTPIVGEPSKVLAEWNTKQAFTMSSMDDGIAYSDLTVKIFSSFMSKLVGD